jgi:hypothetical protein
MQTFHCLCVGKKQGITEGKRKSARIEGHTAAVPSCLGLLVLRLAREKRLFPKARQQWQHIPRPSQESYHGAPAFVVQARRRLSKQNLGLARLAAKVAAPRRVRENTFGHKAVEATFVAQKSVKI